MLSIELTGGFGLYFGLYIGEDCHSQSGKKIGVSGYCASNCKCGNISNIRIHTDPYVIILLINYER